MNHGSAMKPCSSATGACVIILSVLFPSSTDNLADIIALFYKLVCDEKKSKIYKPKVAPKPILGDNKHQITKDDLPQVICFVIFI